MKRIVVFGTGKYWNHYKTAKREDVFIVALLDNDPQKIGTIIDGIKVYSPSQLGSIDFDEILLLSGYYHEMRKQLKSLGVPSEKVCDVDQVGRFFDLVDVCKYGTEIRNEGKKILCFSIALNSTGANNALFTCIKALKQNGFRVQVIARDGGEILDKLLKLAVPVTITNAFCDENKAYSELVNWADEIIVNTIWMYQVVYELEKCDWKVIWWLHENGALEYLDNNYVRNLLSDRNVTTWYVSNTVRKIVSEYIGLDVRGDLLSFGIEHQSAVRSAFSNEKISVGCIGHIGRGKGQDLFVRAIQRLSDDIKRNAMFYIVGAGIMDEESEQIVSENPNIIKTGEIPYEKMHEVYNELDAIACCSREEGMSSVVVEASMYKRTSIVTNIAGITDYLIDGENAIIFESENIEDLSEKIKWIIKNRENAKQIGEASYSMYEDYFSYNSFEKRLLSLLG